MAGIVWFLGDTHVMHKKIVAPRGFQTQDEHDNAVAKSIVDTVGKRDSLYLLGDICFGSPETFYALLLKHLSIKYGCTVRTLNFDVKVTQGNHDSSAMLDYCQSIGFINKYASLFEHRFESIKLVSSHVPIHPDCLDRWKFNVHGHSHDKTINDPRYKCVSWEQYRRPVSLKELMGK